MSIPGAIPRGAPDPVRVTLVVNGSERTAEVSAGRTLLDLLRWNLDLTGTKECCAEGECGACTVRLDGEPVNACLVLAAEANGHEVTTVEGLAPEGRLGILQDAFLDAGAVQCGFCIPGMLMAADALLRSAPDPDSSEIREALSGNLCRCGGYTRIERAVVEAARRMQAAGR